ncbi:MAG TPA: hypothetical protein DCL73_12315 [Treponema sp.]|nr:hypothetical protein [Treponema sp.]
MKTVLRLRDPLLATAAGICSGTTTAGTDPTKPTEITQRSFSEKYGSEFGNNACAATSLLNEISEEYTAATGKTMTTSQVEQAMAAAGQSEYIDSTIIGQQGSGLTTLNRLKNCVDKRTHFRMH